MATKKEPVKEEKLETEVTEEENKGEAQAADDPYRMVKVKLFRDNNMYKEAMYVAVNGRDYLVPRGVEVELPAYVAEVIENSIRQDEKNADRLMRLEQEYLNKG